MIRSYATVAGTGTASSTRPLRLARREPLLTRCAFFFFWCLVFTIPWENLIVIPNLGTVAHLVGYLALGIGLLAVIDRGRLNRTTGSFLPHRGIRILEMPQFPLDGRSRSHSDRNSNNHSDGCNGLATSSARLLTKTAPGSDTSLCARDPCVRLRHHLSIHAWRQSYWPVPFHRYRL